VSVTDWPYATPEFGCTDKVTCGVWPMTVMLKEVVTEAAGLSESFTVTEKLDDPAAVGVPVIVPLELSVRPAGTLPEASA
jgi:hypothetical protein